MLPLGSSRNFIEEGFLRLLNGYDGNFLKEKLTEESWENEEWVIDWSLLLNLIFSGKILSHKSYQMILLVFFNSQKADKTFGTKVVADLSHDFLSAETDFDLKLQPRFHMDNISENWILRLWKDWGKDERERRTYGPFSFLNRNQRKNDCINK